MTIKGWYKLETKKSYEAWRNSLQPFVKKGLMNFVSIRRDIPSGWWLVYASSAHVGQIGKATSKVKARAIAVDFMRKHPEGGKR